MTDLTRFNWDQPDTTPSFLAERDPTQRLRDWVDLFREVVKAAEFLSKTPFVPREMTGKPADVAAAIMKGHELGMDPLDALANIFVVHGRVGFYAEFMRRRIIQFGHTFKIIESTDNRCVVEGTRRDGGDPQRASFTNEQARRAGIDLGRYPADKLVARATSRLCRQVFPDVLSGTLIAEDLIDGLIPTDEPTTPAEAEPAETRPALKRARKPRTPKATATQAPTEPSPAADDTDDLLDDDAGLTAGKSGGRAVGLRTPPPASSQNVGGGEPPPSPDPATDPTDNDLIDHIQRAQDTWNEGVDHEYRQTMADNHAMGEPPIDQPEPERPATPAQHRAMFAFYRDHDLNEKADQLTIITDILGYRIESRANITITEASRIIDTYENTWPNDPDTPIKKRIDDILLAHELRETEQADLFNDGEETDNQ
jgi:hypothetical protein